jgi:protein TonB
VLVTLVSLNAQSNGVQTPPRVPDHPHRQTLDQPAPVKPAATPAQGGPSASPSEIAEAGPAGQAALQAPDGKDVEIYQETLLNYIERYRGYPDAARRNHVEGVVMLRFAMDRQGHVLEAWVDQSSGFTALDTEAVATVWRAQPLPVIPASLPGRLSVVLPVSFSLR